MSGGRVVFLDAAACTVTATPSTIGNDGLDSSVIRVRVLDDRGEPMQGLAADKVVLAATGTGNTLTQPTGFTDSNGEITGSLVSTNIATKVVSATVLDAAVTDTASVVVESSVPPTIYIESDFASGVLSPFTNPYGDRITILSDPTGSGRGNVCRVTFEPASPGASMTRGFNYGSGPQIRYNEEIWYKADFYLVDTGGNYNDNHNRKLFDWQGFHVRMTLNRDNGILEFSAVDAMATGSEQERVAQTTGIALATDTWHTIEIRMITNSADGVRDGILEVYMNESPTPTYSRTTNLGWITENGGASYFEDFLTGFQLTLDGTDPTYEDVRYFDNVIISSGRV